jgi:ABC-type bacteriocin/lantibiotic exporter with double-glycine peptidase domain
MMLTQLIQTLVDNAMLIIGGVVTVSAGYVSVGGMIVFYSILELRHKAALEVLDKRIELEKARTGQEVTHVEHR